MKHYGEVDLQRNYLRSPVLPLDTNFPAAPVAGQLVFKNSTVYVCISVTDGLPVWVPLTRELHQHTHTQSIASLTWTINHNLKTRDVFVTIYDSSNLMVMPSDIQIVDINTISVTWEVAATGKAVVITGHTSGNMIPQVAYTHTQTNPSTSWAITHNLGRNPLVQVFVGNQEVQPASTTFNTLNTMTIGFSTPQVGYVKLI